MFRDHRRYAYGGLPCAYFLLCMTEVGAQNLVPNSGFEEYTSCPTVVAQIDSAAPWFNAAQDVFLGPTPDYFNACASSTPVGVPGNVFGHQPAHNGDAYAGMIVYWDFPATWFTEYIEVQLTSPMVQGQCYEFKAYVSLTSLSQFAISDLGVHFADTVVVQSSTGTNLAVVPQLDHLGGMITDTLNWVEVSGIYEAFGGERYMVIGNFRDSVSSTVMTLPWTSGGFSCYLYIDDVSVTPLSAACVPLGVGPSHSALAPGTVDVIGDGLSIRCNTIDGVRVAILDVSGRTVWRSPSVRAATVPLADLPSGLMLCVLEGANGERSCQRVVVPN